MMPGSKLAQHPPFSKPRTSLLSQALPHTFGETVNTAPGFAIVVDTTAVLNALARILLIRKADIFLTAFPYERIKLPFLSDVCR